MQELILAWLQSHSALAFLGAFGAGTLTAAAPCSLVSVPLLVGSAAAFNKDLTGKQKVLYTYLFTLLFAFGVVISFSVLGLIVAKFEGFFSIAPMWAYFIAGFVSILLGLYALGLIRTVDKSAMMRKFIKLKLFGALIIGLIFGLVSTPCASAPLFAIITAASSSGYLYAYALIFTFAIGHSLLLLIAGVSIGFAQNITSNRTIAILSDYINKAFALMLIGFGFYFFYEGYLQL